MTPRRPLIVQLAPLLIGAACAAAYAEPPAARPALSPPQVALAIAPSRIRARYEVQILGGDGDDLPTYRLRDRFYVLGAADQRYVIRVVNPTARRIEAVVSVDGLDVIDGDSGDLRKRGYIVPAYGETRIEGFRTSRLDVATFRFSSVADSYAGQQGRARNVGVIAVALFEEQPPPPEQEIVGAAPPPPWRPRRGDARPSGPAGAEDRVTTEAPTPRAAPTAPPPAAGARAEADAVGSGLAEAPAAGSAPAAAARDERAPRAQSPRERAGLGTEFGEQRYSSVSYTRFVRAAGRPVAIAELRYNDAAGLIALGIPVDPLPDAGELELRENADPFPGDRFARPPR